MGANAKPYKGQADKNAFDKALQAFAQTPLGGRLFISVFPAIDKRLMPLTKGRVRVGVGQPVLLLHARGARSGEPRVTPLLYTPLADGRIVLIASKAGAPKHPAWFHNVKANPGVEVEIRGERRAMRGRIAEGDERDELWAAAADHYSGYPKYQERAGDRVIPVVVLEPQAAAGTKRSASGAGVNSSP